MEKRGCPLKFEESGEEGIGEWGREEGGWLGEVSKRRKTPRNNLFDGSGPVRSKLFGRRRALCVLTGWRARKRRPASLETFACQVVKPI